MNPPRPSAFLLAAVMSSLLAGALGSLRAQGDTTPPPPAASPGGQSEHAAVNVAFGEPARPETGTAGGKAKHVVLVIWDGLRPDSISDETTPTLAKLAREGVFFARHHPVYPSSTEVNGTAMATGCYPAHSGLIGNREYRPAIDPLRTVATEVLPTIRKGDEATGGKYLRVPTLAELLHAAGARTLVAGTKPVVALMDRAARPDRLPTDHFDDQSVVVYEGRTLPPGFGKNFVDLGVPVPAPFPPDVHFPNVEEDAWTTDALTGWLWHLWRAGPPRFSVLWMSDPDYTQHQFGPESPQARRALASVDANLARLLERLGPARADTDVFVVSDHGFSTIGPAVNFAERLAAGGFNASREWKATPQPGDILVNGLGGSVYLYVAGHDAETIRRAVAFLQGSEFAGVIFTREAQAGTFPLSAIHIDSPDAPDIAVALRWTEEKNAVGFPGLVTSDGGRRPGQGTHASLSRYDMHNTLVAAGPDLKVGWRDELPSGNVDLAPTMAYLLGLPNPPKMDGRVLAEALAKTPDLPAPGPASTERMLARQDAGGSRWSQYLQVTRFGGVDYTDEGNGSAGPIEPDH